MSAKSPLPLEIVVAPESEGSTPVIETSEAAPAFFSADLTGQSMPSVTSLLERKKLQLGAASQTRTQTSQASMPPPVPSAAGPKVIPFKGRTVIRPPELIRWTEADLKKNKDPLALLILAEMAKGTRAVVFLAISPQERSSKDPSIPLFCAQAFVAPDGDPRPNLLIGMKWDPTLVPQIWNAIRTLGRAEFLPPATQTDLSSERNAIRAALAAQTDEKLTLVRIDEGNQCRGVLTLYSTGS